MSSPQNAIKDIADRNDLFAPNVAIEAARAGKQGSGFAGVKTDSNLGERPAPVPSRQRNGRQQGTHLQPQRGNNASVHRMGRVVGELAATRAELEKFVDRFKLP